MKLLASYLILLLLVFTGGLARAENPAPEKLGEEMGARIARVQEFSFLREEAAKLGVRVYLFGGTAAAYGHYVRQDMARESGDARYPAHLYDYDYTNIFRSTQDLDVVVDGAPEKAEALEKILKEKFPHFVGDKAAKWEVRSLREDRGDKEALLDNLDFSNQHTDSHSTGLVEVSVPPKGETAVKDLRDWDAAHPFFLKDTANQKLHYYFNPLHESTARAKNGLNPPILSAIRYLTKAFQYDLEIGAEDKAKIQEIVRAFRPTDIQNDYVKKWIEKNGKKLFQHAVDLEYAWDTLNELGLRQKLSNLRPDPDTIDSLSWWMNKEPLRTQALGQGEGKTAAALAEEFGKEKIILSHETNSFLAYESITRSKAGDLNALVSRQKKPGEMAMHGDGFYTRIGRKGARQTGFTVRMELDPRAREGHDFERSGDFIILKNRAAVKVIPEQINLSLVEYFRQLKDGKEFSEDDRALLEAFKRRTRRAGSVSAEDWREIEGMVKSTLADINPNWALVDEWFDHPESLEHLNFLDPAVTHVSTPEKLDRLVGILQKRQPANTAWMEKLLRMKLEEVPARNLERALAKYALPARPDHPEWAKEIIRRGRADDRMARDVFTQHAWTKHPELLLPIIAREDMPKEIITESLKLPGWSEHPELVEALLKKGSLDGLVASELLSQDSWAQHEDLIQKLVDRGTADENLLRSVLHKNIWEHRPEWPEKIFTRNHSGAFIMGALTSPQWADRQIAWIDTLIHEGKTDAWFVNYIFFPHYNSFSYPEDKLVGWVKAIIDRRQFDKQLVEHVLFSEPFQKYPELLDTILARGGSTHDLAVAKNISASSYPNKAKIIRAILKTGNPEVDEELIKGSIGDAALWHEHPEWIETILNRKNADGAIAQFILSDDHWAGRKDWLEQILARGKADSKLAQYAVRTPNPATVELARTLISRGGKSAEYVGKYALMREEWAGHPELLEDLIKTKSVRSTVAGTSVLRKLVNMPHWVKSVTAALEGKDIPVNSDLLYKAFEEGLTFHKLARIPSSCGEKFSEVSK